MIALGAVFVVASLVASGLVHGCTRQDARRLEPVVFPPSIAEKGVLRAGVDLNYPPFGGTDKGRKAGLDVDVASALAGRLGLRVELVDVAPSEAASALADGIVDVVLSVPLSSVTSPDVSFAGSYVSDAPILFAVSPTSSVEPSLTVRDIKGVVAAQTGSAAYWYLTDALTPESVKGYKTLREPLETLAAGDVGVVGGDALVGAYIARDLSGVRMVGQLQPAELLGVAVKADNAKLEALVRQRLDALAADGVLEQIRTKWVGALPKLELSASQESSKTAP